MSYAVIQTGGKQYRVEADDILDVEKLEGDAGTSVTFDVLALSTGGALSVGTPLLGAKVTGEIVDQFRAKKLIAYKKKRRKGYERKVGHRQSLTKIRITNIG